MLVLSLGLAKQQHLHVYMSLLDKTVVCEWVKQAKHIYKQRNKTKKTKK
jgi:hypothetical protein